MGNTELIALSTQIALRNDLDTLANNIANLRTTGFKSDQLLFSDYLMPTARYNDQLTSLTDRRVHYVQDWKTIHDISQGQIIRTGGDLDIAIEGEGFLVIATPAGQRYSRNGSLYIDANGALVNSSGYPVLGEGGNIVFSATDNAPAIALDGTISTNEGIKGKLQIVTFDNPYAIRKQANNLFVIDDPRPATFPKVRQGFVESSNVNAIREMANLIEVQRKYVTVAKFLSDNHDLRQRALNVLGKLG